MSTAPFEANSYFCTQWTETGTEEEKQDFHSIKWVTLSGTLAYVVLLGAREREKDRERCRGGTFPVWMLKL